ncbi:hypothetical protein LZ32DRAFT_95281 [Colletotrichum eremochloae]|nr:hypothetical protein LZ32DRAFT_95281 [Colletotrichum eremochloae]
MIGTSGKRVEKKEKEKKGPSRRRFPVYPGYLSCGPLRVSVGWKNQRPKTKGVEEEAAGAVLVLDGVGRKAKIVPPGYPSVVFFPKASE